uniref:Uncharacterized protein n=1 Tax=Cacopsylla melanoneura TaxID=428564 RepID=A0A8D9APS9_9HEMI
MMRWRSIWMRFIRGTLWRRRTIERVRCVAGITTPVPNWSLTWPSTPVCRGPSRSCTVATWASVTSCAVHRPVWRNILPGIVRRKRKQKRRWMRMMKPWMRMRLKMMMTRRRERKMKRRRRMSSMNWMSWRRWKMMEGEVKRTRRMKRMWTKWMRKISKRRGIHSLHAILGPTFAISHCFVHMSHFNKKN